VSISTYADHVDTSLVARGQGVIWKKVNVGNVRNQLLFIIANTYVIIVNL